MNSFRRPNTSPARPLATSSTPNASAYPVSTHWSAEELAPSSCWMELRATFTIETLIRDMNRGTSRTHRMRRRLAGSRAGESSPGERGESAEDVLALS